MNTATVTAKQLSTAPVGAKVTRTSADGTSSTIFVKIAAEFGSVWVYEDGRGGEMSSQFLATRCKAAGASSRIEA